MVATRITKKQKRTIAELEKIARELGLRVSAGDMRFAGLKLKSGHCLFRGETWVVVDRRQPFEEQVEVLSEAIGTLDWKQLELSPELEKAITKNMGAESTKSVPVDGETTP